VPLGRDRAGERTRLPEQRNVVKTSSESERRWSSDSVNQLEYKDTPSPTTSPSSRTPSTHPGDGRRAPRPRALHPPPTTSASAGTPSDVGRSQRRSAAPRTCRTDRARGDRKAPVPLNQPRLSYLLSSGNFSARERPPERKGRTHVAESVADGESARAVPRSLDVLALQSLWSVYDELLADARRG